MPPKAAPSGLQKLSFPDLRPKVLDPNGVDVVKEIPSMQQVYAATNEGRGFGGHEEAGYSIFGPGGNHTPMVMGPEAHLSIPAFKDGTAVVHTHPLTGDPRPSFGDAQNAQKSGLPNYVYSARDGHQSLNGVNPNGSTFSYDIDKWGLPAPQGLQKLAKK